MLRNVLFYGDTLHSLGSAGAWVQPLSDVLPTFTGPLRFESLIRTTSWPVSLPLVLSGGHCARGLMFSGSLKTFLLVEQERWLIHACLTYLNSALNFMAATSSVDNGNTAQPIHTQTAAMLQGFVIGSLDRHKWGDPDMRTFIRWVARLLSL